MTDAFELRSLTGVKPMRFTINGVDKPFTIAELTDAISVVRTLAQTEPLDWRDVERIRSLGVGHELYIDMGSDAPTIFRRVS